MPRQARIDDPGALHHIIARGIEKLERKLSPVRDLVKVVPVGTSDYKELISIGGAASGWVGESDTRSETGTPQLREVTPTHGEVYAYPQASEWSLDDALGSADDLDGWLGGLLALGGVAVAAVQLTVFWRRPEG